MSEYWVGNRFKELREQRRLTQAQLAKKVGCTGGHISQIESRRSAPSLSLLKKVASVFQVHWLWLLADLPLEACEVAEKIATLSPDRRPAAARLFQLAVEMAELVSTWQGGSVK
ncbi:MAG: hypothetical protein A3H28_05530 [Acidobacteria bacterium RIFCSPLOWO2_02_FULL_61_28]|nr:MAG: hypothetical protein A3H28_05530 [Acidobacteria bacterium RIFCSPLOWO2_02_FULL_61_28]